MLSSISRSAPKALTRASYRVGNISRRSMLTLGDQMKNREKVEEDRYMRAQAEVWKEKLRALKSQEETKRQGIHFSEVVEPVMQDVAAMLGDSGDKVSDEGLMTLAKWKLDL